MIVYIEVIIGVVVGLVTSWLLNIVKRPSNRVWQRRTEVLGIAMGVLGAISATQFVSYGLSLLAVALFLLRLVASF